MINNIVSGQLVTAATLFFFCMFVPFAILMMPLVKQTAQMGVDNWVGVILCYLVFYMPMNVMLYSGYLKNIPIALEEAAFTAPLTTPLIICFWQTR